MSENEFKQMAGIFPTEEMKKEKENRKELAEKSKLAAKNGLLSLLGNRSKEEEILVS